MADRFEMYPCAAAVDRELWNRLARYASPMMEWEYFYALEESGAVSFDRGYRPCHLVAYSDHQPIALAPLYERDRPWVEFGDGGLIEFLTQLTGLPFYHGLVAAIPLTPVPDYQFLHRSDIDPASAYRILLSYIDSVCEARGLSSCRIYFLSPSSSHLHALLTQRGYVTLRAQYSLWFNRSYRTFEDYLGSFKSSRRTKIKRELRTIQEQGIQLRMVEGTEAPVRCFEEIYQLYLRTWVKHMGAAVRPFLNRAFFELLEAAFRPRTRFAVAYRSEKRIAMAIFYHKMQQLYGRYWGCFETVPFLHFTTCYYYPIAHAIESGVRMMDPGFGGEHKSIRGYETIPVYHYIKFYGEEQRRVASSILDRIRLRAVPRHPRS